MIFSKLWTVGWLVADVVALGACRDIHPVPEAPAEASLCNQYLQEGQDACTPPGGDAGDAATTSEAGDAPDMDGRSENPEDATSGD